MNDLSMGMTVSKYFSLAMLVIFTFVTNVGIWSDHSNWLTHDLEHNVSAMHEGSTADYVAFHDTEIADAISATSPLAVEHELLHAANHLQFFLGTNLNISFLPIAPFLETYFNFGAVPLAALDAPFRPPRLTPSPI